MKAYKSSLADSQIQKASMQKRANCSSTFSKKRCHAPLVFLLLPKLARILLGSFGESTQLSQPLLYFRPCVAMAFPFPFTVSYETHGHALESEIHALLRSSSVRGVIRCNISQHQETIIMVSCQRVISDD